VMVSSPPGEDVVDAVDAHPLRATNPRARIATASVREMREVSTVTGYYLSSGVLFAQF
jgi:hypothetical protein